jgi:tetratricopeptide (TPR) repeat protein
MQPLDRVALYRAPYLVGKVLFAAALVVGAATALIRDHHPPGISLEYGPYVRELMARGDYVHAAAQMRLALSLDPTLAEAPARLALGQALARAGDLQAAVVELRRAAVLAPHDAQAQVELGNTYAAAGNWPAATQAFEAAVAIDPQIPGARAKLAWARASALRGRNDVDGAVRSYREALGIEPSLTEARLELATALAGRGDLEGAATELRTVVQQRPNDPRGYLLLARALAEQRHRDQALVVVQHGLAVLPNDPDLRRLLEVLNGR